MAKDDIEIIPGWKLTYDEVSNDVYKFLAVDEYGRQVGTTDDDFERGMETCKQYAIDIQKQLER